jgi:hypothetical protein
LRIIIEWPSKEAARAFTFEAFVAGSPGKIPSSVLGDECVRGSDIVRDPFLGGRRDGKN